MSPEDNQPQQNSKQYAFNLALAAVAGQVGCLAFVIILVALFGGLWLDNLLATRPLFTIILLVGSVPVTLIAMFWLVRKATAHIKPAGQNAESIEEEADRGK